MADVAVTTNQSSWHLLHIQLYINIYRISIVTVLFCIEHFSLSVSMTLFYIYFRFGFQRLPHLNECANHSTEKINANGASNLWLETVLWVKNICYSIFACHSWQISKGWKSWIISSRVDTDNYNNRMQLRAHGFLFLIRCDWLFQ